MLKNYRAAFIGSEMAEVKKLQRHIKNMTITMVMNSTDPVDYDEIFTREDIDLIIVNRLPSAPMLFLLQAQHCKKPIFFEDCYFNLVETESLKKMLPPENVSSLHVGFMRRFDPHLAHLQQEIKNNVLGKLYLVKMVQHYTMGSEDQALLSALDCVQFITEQPIKEIFSMKNNCATVISLRMQNDVLVVIDLKQQTTYGFDQRLEVLGEKGTLLMDNMTEASTLQCGVDGITAETMLQTTMERYAQARQLQLSAFFQSLNQNAFTGWKNLHAVLDLMELAQTIEISATESKAISCDSIAVAVGL